MRLPLLLGLLYLGSETLLALTRRSRGSGARQDKGSLLTLWLVIAASVSAAVFLGAHSRKGSSLNPAVTTAAISLFAAGLALRWWAIVVLGRFFTVDVKIAHDHTLVDRGPFRLIRHPSYAGVLLAFLGYGVSLNSAAAMLVLMPPIGLALAYRMRVEEEALSGALGNTYRDYMQRTKRLIPGIY